MCLMDVRLLDWGESNQTFSKGKVVFSAYNFQICFKGLSRDNVRLKSVFRILNALRAWEKSEEKRRKKKVKKEHQESLRISSEVIPLRYMRPFYVRVLSPKPQFDSIEQVRVYWMMNMELDDEKIWISCWLNCNLSLVYCFWV